MNKELWYGIGAYVSWGLLPIYWKILHDVPAMEILAHRMVWSLLFVAVLLAYQQDWRVLREVWKRPRTVFIYFVAALFLAINWGIYIWAVNNGHVIDASLGYFINPLVNVLFGVLFLGERLRPVQIVAITLALFGVLYMTLVEGRVPYIALVLAFSFGIYGLLKKKARLPALEGFSLETALLFLPALGYLLLLEWQGTAVFGHASLSTSIWLALTGIVTATPLLLFAAAAHKVTLTTLGIMQYLAPTLQFALGIYLFQEAFEPTRLVGFGFIWLALIVYTGESYWLHRRYMATKNETPTAPQSSTL
ncbi:MAG: EamA family transporter RarD [Chloroflexi bacterium]|nr:EamA family transporter RarD [Chloroflexota bacterium]